MKQIDIIRTYAQKRCLIVDSMPNIRAHLKQLLVDFGVKDIETAGNAEEAFDLCEKKQYDIVLSDYTLGAGKNGQQLLEELRFHQLLRQSAIFIMITAENTSHSVLHALEYRPDDFLQKPVNKEGLRARLDGTLLKNEYLLKVKTALDTHQIDLAIKEALRLADQSHRYQTDAIRTLSELYLRNNEPENAERVFLMLETERPPLWAALGMARVFYAKKNHSAAEKRLISILDEHPLCVEAQDLLAKIYELTHRSEKSQQALLNAIKMSPRSPQRQRELGRVSLNIEDENTSVHAYRSAIKHAKNSCHEIPDDQLNLADSLLKLSRKSEEGQSKLLLMEAKESLEASEKRHAKHPIVMMRNKLVLAEMHETAGNSELADSVTEEAVSIHQDMRYSVIGNTSIQLCIDCAKAFMDRGKSEEGEAILQELDRINHDVDLSVKIDQLLKEPKTKEGIAYASKLNKVGISNYEKGDIEAAIQSFRKVLKELPNHIGLNLNLIQALANKYKNSGISNEEHALLKLSLKRVGEIPPDNTHHKRFQYLKRQIKSETSEIS